MWRVTEVKWAVGWASPDCGRERGRHVVRNPFRHALPLASPVPPIADTSTAMQAPEALVAGLV